MPLLKSIVFGKSRLIFKECFSFLNFCTSEIIHCMFFPASLRQTLQWYTLVIWYTDCQPLPTASSWQKQQQKNYPPSILCLIVPILCSLLMPSMFTFKSFCWMGHGTPRRSFCALNWDVSMHVHFILQLSSVLFKQSPCIAIQKED